MYIIIDSILLIKYNPLSSHINPLDIQNIIAEYDWSHIDKLNNKIKKEASIIDHFKEFIYKEESSNYAYKVAQNMDSKGYDSIQTLILFTQKISTLIFKPQCANDVSNNQFLICHEKEILIFDESNYICIKRIRYQFNSIKRIEYSNDEQFILISLDDNYVYGINYNENRCVFCLEGHKNFVSDLTMRKNEGLLSSLNSFNLTTNNNSSSFKEICFDDYLKTFDSNDIVVINNKENRHNNSDSIFSETTEEDKVIINNNPICNEENKIKPIYEIITVGADGLIGLWKYIDEESIYIETNHKTESKLGDLSKTIIKPPWEIKQANDSYFSYPPPVKIDLEPALNSKQYLHILPLELTVLLSKPLINLYFIDNNTFFTIAMRKKKNNEVFIALLKYKTNHKISTVKNKSNC